ncbi:MAG: V-type ATP synthase subunit A [Deltaproteobacteria bacterium]|nr:V-type ATP synthase subunit A [Deltaproteobacteria bacterium]
MPDKQSAVIWVSGPVVKASSGADLSMYEVVEVGGERLIGEVIELAGDAATIQVYEDTTGIRPGDPVVGQGAPLSVEIGPGLIGQIFDGIQRPLSALQQVQGSFISRGLAVPPLDRERVWSFTPSLQVGAALQGGEVLGTVPETPALEHRVLVPPLGQGTLTYLAPPGDYTLTEIIARVRTPKGKEVSLYLWHRWPVRRVRPYRQRLLPTEPLLTGQRVMDTLFPLAKGGTAAIPGGFGTGKTITQQQLSKWCAADLIVYVGCGERGNEITGILAELPRLQDPRSGHALIERTLVIANTSNMPVAAREASIYTGITLAEAFRDMGYQVALMADSTSRWAEALREISGRLEEMPAEEGFPAYLATRLAEFYERAGSVVTLNGARASVSIIGAVSPPGGDFSEPVTTHTKRFVRCFWGLDKELAAARYFPAINTTDSYSEYADAIAAWWAENIDPAWKERREETLALLQEDYQLQRIVKLLGEEALPDAKRLTLEAARWLKEGFLQQRAFDPQDMFCSPQKQMKMLHLILGAYRQARGVLAQGIPFYQIRAIAELTDLLQMKSRWGEDQLDRLEELANNLAARMEALVNHGNA